MNIESILKDAKLKVFIKNEIVFKEGEPSVSGIGFVLEGELIVYKDYDKEKVIINHVPAKTFIGEIGIIFKAPRRATVVVKSDYAKIIFINKQIFLNHAKNNTKFALSLIQICTIRIKYLFNELLLQKKSFVLPIPKNLDDILFKIRNSNLNIKTLMNNSATYHYKDGQVIYKEDTEFKSLYLISSGIIELRKKFNNEDIPIIALGGGDILGFLDCFENTNHTYSAVAATENVSIVEIDKSAFFKILKNEPELVFNLFQTLLIYLISYESAFVTGRVLAKEEIQKEYNDLVKQLSSSLSNPPEIDTSE